MNDHHFFEVAKEFDFPLDLEIVVPLRDDKACTTLIDFSTIYVDQLKADFQFPLFHLLVEVLDYYNISFSITTERH